MKQILVPIDFSKTSIEALRQAEIFAEKFGASLMLLHVVEKAPFMSDMRNVPLAMSEDEVAEKAKVDLTLLAKRELKEKTTRQINVRVGKAYQEINEAAKELRADLIVISTHGYTGLKHTLLGSTTERVVRHAPCPVLVVRKQE
jgi:nucleotide-binding universal stress UspA family protein